MQLEVQTRTTRSRGRVALIAILIGAIWTIGGLLPLGGQHSDPMTFLDQSSSLTFSAMLAVFALVAWLVVGLARPSRWILAVAAIMGIGGIVAGIGNFAEEMLRIPGAEYLYGLGLLPLFIGMIATAIVLLVRRERVPAILMFLSIAGFIIAMGRGPNVLPVVWFGFAAWAFFRAPPEHGLTSRHPEPSSASPFPGLQTGPGIDPESPFADADPRPTIASVDTHS